jgi:hypothetical protein
VHPILFVPFSNDSDNSQTVVPSAPKDLDPFNLFTVELPSNTVVMGPTKCGKTVLVNKIVTHLRTKYGTELSVTEITQKKSSEFAVKIDQNFEPFNLTDFLQNVCDNANKMFLLVIDGYYCTRLIKLYLAKLFTSGCKNLSTILTTQYPDVAKPLTKLFTYRFCFYAPFDTVIKNYYKYFLHDFDSLEQFVATYKKYTADEYTFIVSDRFISQTFCSNKIDEESDQSACCEGNNDDNTLDIDGVIALNVSITI